MTTAEIIFWHPQRIERNSLLTSFDKKNSIQHVFRISQSRPISHVKPPDDKSKVEKKLFLFAFFWQDRKNEGLTKACVWILFSRRKEEKTSQPTTDSQNWTRARPCSEVKKRLPKLAAQHTKRPEEMKQSPNVLNFAPGHFLPSFALRLG